MARSNRNAETLSYFRPSGDGNADVEMQNKVYGHDGPGLRRLKDIVEKLDYRFCH
jgi:hypothetical protein